MATVNKDFRIKSGLVVEGTNATVNGSSIITEATLPGFELGADLISETAITGGTQENITVTYDSVNKVVNFVAENGVADSTTDDLTEGSTNLYFTDERAQDALAAAIAAGTHANITISYDDANNTLSFTAENGVADSTTDDLAEGVTNLYFTDERAQDAFGNLLINSTQSGISVTYDDANGNVDFDVNDPTITISGDVDGSATMTNLGDTEIAVTLDTVNSDVGTFGSSTEIPSVTVDGKGRVTAVTTNSISTDLNIAGDTGTDTVTSGDTLTFDGGDGIATTVTDNQVSFAVETATGIEISPLGAVQIDATVATLEGAQNLKNKNIEGATIQGATIVSGSQLDANSTNIINLAEPTNPQDAATKNYVDSAVSGLEWKSAVNLFADANVDISGDLVGLVLDGHAALDITDAGYRLLLTAQTTDSENGIYELVDNGGALEASRPDDADVFGELVGSAVFVMEGTTYGSTSWVQTNHYLSDFTGQNWTQFSGQGTYTAGSNLTLTGNEFDLASAISVDSVTSVNSLAIQSTGDAVSIVAAKGISLSSQDGTVLETDTYVGDSSTADNLVSTSGDLAAAVSDLTDYVDGFLDASTGTTVDYIDTQDAAVLSAANGYTDALIATGDATASPTYLELDVNSVAKQVAASSTSDLSADFIVYEFDASVYRSAKFLVKLANGTHTQVSEVLVTLDTSNNVAVMEYALVGTNGSLGDVSASYSAADTVRLTLTSTLTCDVTVSGTLLV